MAKKDEVITSVSDMTKHVEKGDIKNVYLFHGDEEYLKNFFVKKLCGRVTDGVSDEIIHFDGKIKAPDLQNACESMPMFGGNTVVTVRDSGIFKNGGSGADNDFGFLAELPEDSFVFFRETEIDKRNKNYKILEDHGMVFECKYQKPEMIVKILERQAISQGRHISADAVSLMVTGIGSDLVRLINEVNKLSHLVGEGETIQASHVREVCELSLSARIFDLTDGIAENNKEKSFTMLQVLLADKMPPQQIMSSIGRHFMQLYNVRCLLDRGASKNEIISALSVHEFVASKLIRQAKVYTQALVSRKIKLISDMDIAIKSGTMDPVNALEVIIGAD